jgi:hypothetical protein
MGNGGRGVCLSATFGGASGSETNILKPANVDVEAFTSANPPRKLAQGNVDPHTWDGRVADTWAYLTEK